MLKWLVFEVGHVEGIKYSDVRAAFPCEYEAREYMDRKNAIYKHAGLDVIFVMKKAEHDILIPEGMKDGKED